MGGLLAEASISIQQDCGMIGITGFVLGRLRSEDFPNAYTVVDVACRI